MQFFECIRETSEGVRKSEIGVAYSGKIDSTRFKGMDIARTMDPLQRAEPRKTPTEKCDIYTWSDIIHAQSAEK